MGGAESPFQINFHDVWLNSAQGKFLFTSALHIKYKAGNHFRNAVSEGLHTSEWAVLHYHCALRTVRTVKECLAGVTHRQKTDEMRIDLIHQITLKIFRISYL